MKRFAIALVLIATAAPARAVTPEQGEAAAIMLAAIDMDVGSFLEELEDWG